MTYTKISERFRRAFFLLAATTRVVEGRASLDFPSIGAGLQATLTIACVGAQLEDMVDLGYGAAPTAGLDFTARVDTADTVTVIAVNNTAGAIDNAAQIFNVAVRRRSR